MGYRSAADASMKPIVAFVLMGVVGGAAGFRLALVVQPFPEHPITVAAPVLAVAAPFLVAAASIAVGAPLRGSSRSSSCRGLRGASGARAAASLTRPTPTRAVPACCPLCETESGRHR